MKNKDTQMLEEAYNQILEAKKKKLAPKEKEIAAAAPPYDKITRADIITLAKSKNSNKKKKNVKESMDEPSYGSSEIYIRLKEENGVWNKSEDGIKLKVDYSYHKDYYEDGELKDIDIDIDKICKYDEEGKEVEIPVEYGTPFVKALQYYIDEDLVWGGHNEEGQW